jgi:hypothetical protein
MAAIYAAVQDISIFFALSPPDNAGMRTIMILSAVLSGCGLEAGEPVYGLETIGVHGVGQPVATATLKPDRPTRSLQFLRPSGLPCDVKAMLQANCAGCHAGAVYITAFSTRGDLQQTLQPQGMSLAAMAVLRLSDVVSPMPPYGVARRPTDVERDVFTTWVSAGMPAGDCGGL